MFVKYNKTRENVESWKRFYPIDEEGTPVVYSLLVEYMSGETHKISYPTREERDHWLHEIGQAVNAPLALLDITPGSWHRPF
jgi:hypothetical protein